MSGDSSRLLNVFLSRRSIRKFSSKPVREADVRKIAEVGQCAPTACNLQTYSIVWVRDAKLRENVLDAYGISGSIRTAPVVFVICADVRRLGKVLDYLGYDHCLKHGYGYSIKLMSIMDASFVAENMTMAAECLGLGSVFVGSALASDEAIKALELPRGVLPLSLLCVGYPDEQPPSRPRWLLSSVLHVNHYRDPAEHEMEAFLKHMNDGLKKEGYYKKYGNRGPRLPLFKPYKTQNSLQAYEERRCGNNASSEENWFSSRRSRIKQGPKNVWSHNELASSATLSLICLNIFSVYPWGKKYGSSMFHTTILFLHSGHLLKTMSLCLGSIAMMRSYSSRSFSFKLS